MTLLDDSRDTESAVVAPADPRWVAPAVGALGGVVSLVLVVGGVVMVWSGNGPTTGTLRGAAEFGAALWLALGGATLQVDRVPVDFLPLLLALVPLATAAASLRWLLRRREESEDGWMWGLLPRHVLRIVLLWWAGYAVPSTVAVALAISGPSPPVYWTILGPLVVLPALAAAIVLSVEAHTDDWLLGPRLDGSVLPVWVRRGLGTSLRGAGLLLGVGAALVLAMVALSWHEVLSVQTAVGGGAIGAAVMWLVQAAALPNLALWGLSFLAGPGFSVVDGAAVSWGGAKSGLMPLIPVFAALPQPQSFPPYVAAVVLVPLLCGVAIARWSLRTIARLSSVGTKILTAGSAAVGSATLIAVLDVVGGSSLGAYRLSDIGSPAGWLWLALAAELLMGAVAAALWDAWRLRR
ncbi:MAG TPA: DUF6350 family protein [Phycicoccus sp.]|nr:DUF6350 family protein [Phycicoccus sp.]HQH08303.1 DUF6350 family protein [Phycicoccus sp.]HQK31974.1 DUF6350 family protein [Phycicoccus sp.]HQY96076.1 DUF6350 family protein [Phycicoccus sp.]HRA44434.1 DUF6350 family protein [Phycicoccus sp.]